MVGFGGMRLLIVVPGDYSRVVCVFGDHCIAQEGNPQAWREFPHKELS